MSSLQKMSLPLYDRQRHVTWEFKSQDEIPKNAPRKVLSEANEFAAGHRALIVLPSGAVLEVDASVLLCYCHALRPYAADVLEKVLWPTYFSASVPWRDIWIEDLFETLHRDRLQADSLYIEGISMYPSQGILIAAFGIEAAAPHFRRIALDMVSGTGRPASVAADNLFKWIHSYQLLTPNYDALLNTLAQLHCEQFELLLKLEWHRKQFLDVFTAEEIVELAHARWNGRCFQRERIPQVKEEEEKEAEGEVILEAAKFLPQVMQLKMIIADDFSITGTCGMLTARSPFIREMLLDEDASQEGPVVIYLPFVSTFPRNEVVEFFTLIEDRSLWDKEIPWKVSWVQLADHLLISKMLDEAAKWVWDLSRAGTLTDWHPHVTSLHSMRQRQPADQDPEMSSEDLLAKLKTTPAQEIYVTWLAAAIEYYGARLVELVGMNVFCTLLAIKRHF